MFTVKKKPLTPNIIWDSSAGRPLCNFGHKGLLKTNDMELARKLEAMGHTVTGEAEVPAQPDPEQPGDGAESAQLEETAAQEPQAEQPGETAEAPTTKERRNRK